MIKKTKSKVNNNENPAEEPIEPIEELSEKQAEKVENKNKYTRECLCGSLIDLSGDSEVFICSCGRKHIR